MLVVGHQSIVILPTQLRESKLSLSYHLFHLRRGANNLANVTPFSPCVSPFASEPSTTSPLLSITNFNMQLASENILATNINYNFEEFIEQLLPANSINGGQSLGLSSGLIDQLGFQNIYRYYYVNLSRRARDDVSGKGITIV